MGDRWPVLPEFMGLAVGALIIVATAIGVIFLAQGLGVSGPLLIAIGCVVSIAAALVIGRALRS